MARAASKRSTRKGASRNKGSTSRKGPPGWLWLLLGLLLAGFVAFLWHLRDLSQEGPRKPAAATSTPAAADAAPAAAGAKAADEEPRFEFYTLLPNQEVMPGSKPAPAQPEAKAGAAGPSFLLQAGSFKSEAEADKRRAAILMLGMPVKVVKVAKDGAPWFRVVVGPFQGKAAADSARASLKGNGVDSLLIKQG